MKDSRNEINKQRVIGSISNVGIALNAGTVTAGVLAANFMTRASVVGQMLVNGLIPAAIAAAAGEAVVDGVGTIIKLCTTKKGRNRNARIIKNMASVKMLVNDKIVENGGFTSTSTNGLNSDARKQAHDEFVSSLRMDSKHMYSEILRDRICYRPNRLQQEILNTLTFRQLTRADGTFNGANLDPNVDYSLSTAYNVLRLKNILNNTKLDAKEKLEAAKIQRQLSFAGMEGLTSQDVDVVKKTIDIYLAPLEPLYETVKDKNGNVVYENGRPKKTLFFEDYLLHGDTYQSFTTPLLNEHARGHNLLIDLMKAHDDFETANGNAKKRGEPFLAEMLARAAQIETDIEELKLTNNQLVALRKRFKNYGVNYQPQYTNGQVDESMQFGKTDAVLLGKDQCQVLEEIASIRRNKQLNAKFSNKYINKDWIKSALSSSVPGRLSRQQRTLAARVVADLSGWHRTIWPFTYILNAAARRKAKNMLKNGTLDSFLDSKKDQIDQMAKGIDLGATYTVDGNKVKKAKWRGFKAQYLVTDNYKLKKFTTPYTTRKEAVKYLPEFKKYAKRNQFFPLTRWFFKHTGLGTYGSLILGAACVLGAFLGGLGTMAALGLGALGAAIVTGTVAEKIHQKRTGRRLFGLWKTKQSRQLDEYSELQKRYPNKHVAPNASITTSNFRNKVIKKESKETKNPFVKFKNWVKRILNNVGYNLSPVSTPLQLIPYPKSFMEAYGQPDERTRAGLTECLQKSIKRGLRGNSDVRFLEQPVEIFIRDKKGKVIEAYHIDQKTLAKDVLRTLLEVNQEAIEGQSRIVDVNIGKTSFRVNPAELNDTVDSQGRPVPGIKRTVNNIVGYATEEQIVRHVNDMYTCVQGREADYGIVCRNGIVVKGQEFARVVNFNAIRDRWAEEESIVGENNVDSQKIMPVYENFDFNGRVVPYVDIESNPQELIEDYRRELGATTDIADDANGLVADAAPVVAPAPQARVVTQAASQTQAPVVEQQAQVFTAPQNRPASAVDIVPAPTPVVIEPQRTQQQTVVETPVVTSEIPTSSNARFTLDDALNLRVTPHQQPVEQRNPEVREQVVEQTETPEERERIQRVLNELVRGAEERTERDARQTENSAREAMRELSSGEPLDQGDPIVYKEFEPNTGNTQLRDQLQAAVDRGELPTDRPAQARTPEGRSPSEMLVDLWREEERRAGRAKSYSEAVRDGEVVRETPAVQDDETLEQKMAKLREMEARLERLKDIKFTTLQDVNGEKPVVKPAEEHPENAEKLTGPRILSKSVVKLPRNQIVNNYFGNIYEGDVYGDNNTFVGDNNEILEVDGDYVGGDYVGGDVVDKSGLVDVDIHNVNIGNRRIVRKPSGQNGVQPQPKKPTPQKPNPNPNQGEAGEQIPEPGEKEKEVVGEQNPVEVEPQPKKPVKPKKVLSPEEKEKLAEENRVIRSFLNTVGAKSLGTNEDSRIAKIKEEINEKLKHLHLRLQKDYKSMSSVEVMLDKAMKSPKVLRDIVYSTPGYKVLEDEISTEQDRKAIARDKIKEIALNRYFEQIGTDPKKINSALKDMVKRLKAAGYSDEAIKLMLPENKMVTEAEIKAALMKQTNIDAKRAKKANTTILASEYIEEIVRINNLACENFAELERVRAEMSAIAKKNFNNK